MNKILAISVATALCLGIAGHAAAGTNPNVNLALDMQAKSKTRTCATMSYTTCSVINQTANFTPGIATLDIVPVVYSFQGITAVGFGLDWTSSSILYAPVWTKCSDLEITTLRATDATFELTWTTCQSSAGGTSGKAAGFLRFTTYAVPGRVHIKASDSGSYNTVDCAFQPDELHTVHDGFWGGALPGPSDLDPCTAGPTATEATTWSGVKALYR